MDKTSKKVTRDPKRQERGKKSHEMYMKRLKEKILEDNQLPTSSTSSSTSDLLHLPLPVTLRLLRLPIPQGQIILMFMTLVCLLSLPLVFVYFLHIAISLKIINKPMKNRINHQKDVIYFRKIYTINE